MNREQKAELRPEDAAYASISSSGVLTAKKVTSLTTVEVTVASKANPAASHTAQVELRPAATSVTLWHDAALVTGKTIVLDIAQAEPQLTAQLSAMCYPYLGEDGADGARQNVIWTSSNPKIAAVDADTGVVTATETSAGSGKYRTGTVTITAKASDGSGKSARVTIKLVKLVQQITLTAAGDATAVAARKTLRVSAALTPADATLRSVTWSLRPQDAAYASINSKGDVTAKRVTGTQQIQVICKSRDGNAVATLDLSVTP